MEKEYVMQIAQIIKEQLVTLTPMTVLMSWSIEEFAATLYRDLPALRIKVNGRLHAGYVIVVLQWLGLLRGLSCEGNGRGMREQRGLFRRTGRCHRPGYRERYGQSRVR